MIAEFLITFRESLEAALVVGIILAYLEKTQNTRYNRHVYLGVAGGILTSVIAAMLINSLFGELEGVIENVFEGSLMLLAAILIAWMVFWMMNQQNIKTQVEQKVGQQLSSGKVIGLVVFTFISVFREGVETVIFISAAAIQNSTNILLGVMTGFAAAVMLAFLIFETAIRVDLKKFFTVTSVILTVFAAGALSHAVHEFQEAGWLPQQNELWSTKHILDDESPVGSLMRVLTGYNDGPTLLETAAYFGYFLVVLAGYQRVIMR